MNNQISNNNPAAFWDQRYSMAEYAYGELPNSYIQKQLPAFRPGTILFPAEGEGRNAVFAARLGWQVFAFDISRAARQKALQLAEKQRVSISYQVGNLDELDYEKEHFDAIALVFAHFPADLKRSYHQKFSAFLKRGGIIILEAFSKRNLDYVAVNEKVGGPRDVELLFSTEEIQDYFADFEIIELKETETHLREGLYHNGLASVIRFIGRKPY